MARPLRMAVAACILLLGCRVGGAARLAQQTSIAGAANGEGPYRSATLVWTQTAASVDELRNLRFSLLVDDTPLPLPHASCDERAMGPLAFECRAPLPLLPSGSHAIQVVSESRAATGVARTSISVRLLIMTAPDGQSSALRIDVPDTARGAARASRDRHAHGVSVVPWATGLEQPRLLASVSRDRVLFVSGDAALYSATSAGASRVPIDTMPAARRILAIALPADPASGHVFVAWGPPPTGGPAVEVQRYTLTSSGLTGGRLVVRVPTHDRGARALMAFGPDRKLYVVVPGAPSSTIYRFNEDGTIPGDHLTPSAVFAEGPADASAFAWNPRTRDLWCVGRSDSETRTLVFPPVTGKPTRFPLRGFEPGGSAPSRRGHPQRVSSLVFLDEAQAPSADAIIVVPDGAGEVLRLVIADDGRVRVSGRYPSALEAGRVTEVSAREGTVFMALDKPGERNSGSIAAVSGAYVSH